MVQIDFDRALYGKWVRCKRVRIGDQWKEYLFKNTRLKEGFKEEQREAQGIELRGIYKIQGRCENQK